MLISRRTNPVTTARRKFAEISVTGSSLRSHRGVQQMPIVSPRVIRFDMFTLTCSGAR
jgi:hypothetical protein